MQLRKLVVPPLEGDGMEELHSISIALKDPDRGMYRRKRSMQLTSGGVHSELI